MNTAALISDAFAAALVVANEASPRSQQSRAGLLGPSDIGWCRQKAVLVTKGVQPSDAKSMWAANVGTAVHNFVEAALKEVYPDWLLGSIDDIKVEAKLSNGTTIGGHPDVVIPAWNTVLDIKTVDGFEWVKRNGSSQAHKWQRWLYALGAAQTGILTFDQPLYYGNVYFDRSGKEPVPIVEFEEFDPTLESEIEQWIEDVTYAVLHDEDAHRDIAAPVCEKICEFFTACRGQLPVSDMDVIDTPDMIQAVETYVEARETEKRATQLKKEAAAILTGANGIVGGWQVRTTEIPETDVPGFIRRASTRLDVRKVRA